jgi:uncharacterized glyoxalase superfamily protein PhnB
MSASLKANLGYRHAQAALHFLVHVLGFKQVSIYTSEDETIVAHAELHWSGGGSVTIYSAEPGKSSVASVVEKAEREGGYPAFSIHLDTETPEVVYERVIKSGAKVVREMRTSPMGRGFIVSDPEGLYWSVGTPLPRLVRNKEGQWQPEANV